MLKKKIKKVIVINDEQGNKVLYTYQKISKDGILIKEKLKITN